MGRRRDSLPDCRKGRNKWQVRTSKAIGALCEAEQRLSGKGLAKVEGSDVEFGSVAEANRQLEFEDGFLSQLIGLAGFGGGCFGPGIGGAIH
jgi:hypothetical protein